MGKEVTFSACVRKNDFNGRKNIEGHIEGLLKTAPSVLRNFKILLAKLKKVCEIEDI